MTNRAQPPLPMAIREAVQVVWDYHHMNHTLAPADSILVLGSHDVRVAEWAAQLWLDGWAHWVIFSGGLGRLTEGLWQQTEAERFGRVARQMGVPDEKILLEAASTNTGENIRYTEELLAKKKLNFTTFIVVQKPYMERRAYATFRRHWPDKTCMVTSPPLSFEEYCASDDPEINSETVIHLLVGDLQRIDLYAKRGFQIPQTIPTAVRAAYDTLVNAGYTRHLIADDKG